jgi:hypothetical protein
MFNDPLRQIANSKLSLRVMGKGFSRSRIGAFRDKSKWYDIFEWRFINLFNDFFLCTATAFAMADNLQFDIPFIVGW